MAGAFVLLGFVVLASTELSPRQVGDKDFGNFSAFAGYGIVEMAPGNDGAAVSLRRSVSAVASVNSMVAVTATDFYLHGGPVAKSRFEEHEWLPNPFPRRYHLDAGRWPQQPGEVALTHLPSALVGKTLSSPDGTVPLRVVGVVDDAYAQQPAVLAAPGAWRLLRESLAAEFVTMRAQPVVYWAGGHDERVLGAIEATLKNREAAADGATTQAATLHDDLVNSYQQRPAVRGDRRLSWLSRIPAGYAVPSVLLPLLTTLVGYGLTVRRLQRLRVVSQSVGLPSSTLVGGYGLRLVPLLTLASLAGSVVGLAAGHLSGPLLETLARRPVDLDVPWLAAAARVAGVTLASSTIITIVAAYADRMREMRRPLSRTRPRPTFRKEPAAPRGVRDARPQTLRSARRLAALAFACCTVVQLPQVDTPGRATAASTGTLLAGLLVLPDAGRWGLHVLGTGSWRRRLVTRRLEAYATGSVVTAALLAVVIGLTFGYLVLLETWLASADAERTAEVAPHSVLVTDRASPIFPPRAATLATVQGALPNRHPIQLRWTMATDGVDTVTRQARLKGGLSHALVIESTSDAAGVLGRGLTPSESGFLANGGSLVWAAGETGLHDGQIARRSIEVVNADDRVLSTTPAVSMLAVPAQMRGWQTGSFGLILESTAHRLGLPISAGALLYVDVPTAGMAAVHDRVSTEAIDPDTVVTYQSPPPLIPAASLPATALVLSALVLILCVSTTWIDARSLTGFLALLTCLGVPPRAARGVLALQQGLVFVLGGVTGLLLAVPPLVIMLVTLPEYTINVPWRECLSLALACALAWAAAMGTTLTRLQRANRALAAASSHRP